MSAEVEVNKPTPDKTDEKIVMGDAEVKNDTKTGDAPEVLSEKKETTDENAEVPENDKNDISEDKGNEENGDSMSEKEDDKGVQKTKEKSKEKGPKKSNSKQNECTDEESVENSEEENEKEEEESEDEEVNDDSKNKSAGRERRQVQRYSEDVPETKEKSVEGSGVALGNVLSIDNNLSRAKPDDLKALHKLLFKNPGKSNMIRKNIRKFNGFDFNEDSEQYTTKLAAVNKLDLKQIKVFCDILSLDKKGTKEELASSICEFLLKPKDNNIIEEVAEETPSGRPRRSAALKASAKGFSDSEDSDEKHHRGARGKGQRASLKDETSSESDYNPSGSEGSDQPKRSARPRGRGRPARSTRKTKDVSDEELSEESEDDSDAPPKKRGRVAKPAAKSVAKRSSRAVNKKKADSEQSESEEESAEDSDEPKSKRGRNAALNNKKTSPANNRGKKAAPTSPAKGRGAPKRGAAGKKAAQQDSSSEESEGAEDQSESEDEPLSKKGKSQPPTDDELKMLVKEILDGANLEEITMKTVCKQVYAKYPQFDLAHKKEFIKTTVKSLIST